MGDGPLAGFRYGLVFASVVFASAKIGGARLAVYKEKGPRSVEEHDPEWICQIVGDQIYQPPSCDETNEGVGKAKLARRDLFSSRLPQQFHHFLRLLQLRLYPHLAAGVLRAT